MALVMIFVTCALLVIVMTAILNTLTFPRLGIARYAPTTQPFISILIPARNESVVIGQTVRGILSQTYADFEVLILDDNSTDGTCGEALKAANGDGRLQVLPGSGLPPGWLGKNWACHQLGQAARGDWLIFTDADVSWQPDALAALVAQMARTQADLLTVWPTQHTLSWGERVVVPLMSLAILGYLPLLLVHYTSWSSFAAANGQCLAFRRQAYEKIGGHAAVRDRIVEDVMLARRVKAEGLRLRMADGAGQITCRMYRDWSGVRDGFAKNILAGHSDSVPLLAISTLFHWLIFAAPWLWLVMRIWPLWSLTLIALGVGTRMLTAVATRQRVVDALFMPVSVFLMTLIAVRAVWWRYRYGGPQWKGRTIANSNV
jgi:chlorobactene glucosyltransferase